MAEITANLPRIYRFDEFRVDAHRRVLLRDGRPVTLNSKTFDLLLVLLNSGGRELSKDQLMKEVWQDQIVEENNLAVHIYNLRKILGERKDEHRYIATIPGHGYKFVGELSLQPDVNADLLIESRTVSRMVVEEEAWMDRSDPNSTVSTVAVSTRPLDAQVVTSRPSGRAQLKKRKSVILGVAVAGVVLAGGAGAYWGAKVLSRSSTRGANSSPITITRLTDGKQIGAPSISSDGKFIAYGENATSGSGGLFVQQVDTNRVVQLLESADRTFGATNFSPDGSLIYYIVFDQQEPDGALYSVPILGGTPKLVARKVGTYFSISSDGRKVAFYRNEPEQNRRSLILASVNASDERILVTRTHAELDFGGPLAWSPDGTFIAFSADSEPGDLESNYRILAIDTKDGTTRSLTNEKFSAMGKMSWTSDQEGLAFVGKRSNNENQVYFMEYPSGSVRSITNDLQAYGNYGLGMTSDSKTMIADVYETTAELWSLPANGDTTKVVRIKSGTTSGLFGLTSLPTGGIAYVARSQNNLDIWTVSEDGSDPKPLTSDAVQQTDVASSPDGRYLVFAASSDGETHIFRMNSVNGSEVTQLTFGASSDSQPDVSEDGNWVVYTAFDGRRRTISKVPLAGGSSQSLTDYASRNPQFSPDGKAIACIIPSTSRAKLASIAVIPVEGGKPIKTFEVMSFGYGQYPYRWSPDGQSLIFRRHTNGVSDLWQQPLSGAEPKQISHFQSGSIWNFDYSSDGARIVLSRGSTFVDAVLIKNFR